MTERDDIARSEILTRLAASREEILRVLDPPPRPEPGDRAFTDRPNNGRGFPRSRTMQMFTSGRGIGTLGALAAGLLIARPALALRLLRMLPASAVAKTLLLRAIGMMRARRGRDE